MDTLDNLDGLHCITLSITYTTKPSLKLRIKKAIINLLCSPYLHVELTQDENTNRIENWKERLR